MTRTVYRHAPQRRRFQSGFTLVEALIALLVMSFGMLALGGMQIALNRNSDVAKQRSEAVRLAQLKLEEMRSFDGLATGVYSYDTNVVSSAADESICPACAPPLDSATNTTFTRRWTVTRADGVTPATSADAEKWIHVTVAWTDRAGQDQEVRLDSVIARNNPIDLQGIVAGQAPAKVRFPKNRNINIPYPAISLPGKMSSFKPPPAGVNYVFSNETGHVLGSCTDAAIANAKSTNTAITFTGTPTVGCTAGAAYLLSGYVRFKTTGAAPNAGTIENTTDNTLPLAPTSLSPLSNPLTIDASATGNGPSAYVCYSQRQKVVQAANVQPENISGATRSGNVVTVTTSASHGFTPGYLVAVEESSLFTFNGSFEIISVPSPTTFTYAQTAVDATTGSGGRVTLIQRQTVEESVNPAGYNTLISRFIAYTCIVTPGTDQNGTAWWGEVRLNPSTGNPTPAWTLGSGAGTYKVCRFSGDYVIDGAMANHEHPRYYRRVTSTLDNQNYLVINGGDACPTDVNANPLATPQPDFVSTNTVLHQQPLVPAERSFWCSNAACSGGQKNVFEPASATVPIPMFCPVATAGCS